MSANTAPIFPVAPVVGIATFTSTTAITSGANITGTTGLTQLTATSTNGTVVNQIIVRGKATTVASTVWIWMYNGTTSFLFDMLDIPANTASTVLDSVLVSKTYAQLALPPTYQLYVSETVQTDLNVFALGGAY